MAEPSAGLLQTVRAIVMFYPAIATTLPRQLQTETTATETEQVDDSMNKLEEDPLKGVEEQLKEEEGAGGTQEKDQALEKAK